MIGSFIDDIGFGIFKSFFSIFVAFPLILIRAIIKLYHIIAAELPVYILFGIKPGGDIADGNLPEMFSRLAIISVIVFLIFFTVAAIRVGFYKSGEQKNPLVVALKYSIIGFLWIIILPIASYGFLILINAILDLLLNGTSYTLDQIIFNSLYSKKEMSSINFDEWVAISNDNYNFTRAVWNKTQSGQGWTIIFTGLIMSLATLIPLTLGLLTLVQKVFQQFVLFIISPFIAATAVADDGKRMKLWQTMFFTKSVVILTFVISIQLLGVFLNRAIGFANTFDDFGMRFLLILGLSAGGAVAAMSMSSVSASFVGESASVRETMSETKGLIASGMTMFGAAKMVGAAGKKVAVGATKAAGKGIELAKNLKTAGAGAGAGSRVQAFKNLKDSFKKGEISKDQFKLEKSALQSSFKEHKQDIKSDKQDFNAKAQEFSKNYGNYNFKTKSLADLRKEEYKLDGEIVAANKKLHSVEKEFGRDSEQYKIAQKQYENANVKRVDFGDVVNAKSQYIHNKDFNKGQENMDNFNISRSSFVDAHVINEAANKKQFESQDKKDEYIKKHIDMNKEIENARKKYENLEFKNKWKKGYNRK